MCVKNKNTEKSKKILRYNFGEWSIKVPFIIYADISLFLKR